MTLKKSYLIGGMMGIICLQMVAETTPPLRDPFWPIGYAPALPEAPAPSAPVVETPVPEAPPLPRVITKQDWQAARNTLKISGVSRTRREDQEECALAMINNRFHHADDTICITNQNVAFTWLIQINKNLQLNLNELEARDLTLDQKNKTKQTHEKE